MCKIIFGEKYVIKSIRLFGRVLDLIFEKYKFVRE